MRELSLALYLFVSYDTVNDVQNSHALFCFSSTTDEHTDTVYLIEGFFSNETVTH